MMVRSLTHICVTGPVWVNTSKLFKMWLNMCERSHWPPFGATFYCLQSMKYLQPLLPFSHLMCFQFKTRALFVSNRPCCMAYGIICICNNTQHSPGVIWHIVKLYLNNLYINFNKTWLHLYLLILYVPPWILVSASKPFWAIYERHTSKTNLIWSANVSFPVYLF